MAGYPIGYFYGYKVAGVYQSQADIDASPKNTLATVTPGDLKFADLSGPDGKPDGKIDLDYDRTIIGDPFPDVSMSLNLNWGWKGIDFNMFWQTVLGRDMYNQGPMVVPFYNDNGNVWKDMVDKRWTA